MAARIRSQVSAYDEILLYTAPHIGPAAEIAVPPSIRTTRYHGWLYTKLPLSSPPLDLASIEPEAEPPHTIGGLPLVRHEELVIHWRRYGEYLSAFYDGDEGLHRLEGFLGDTLSPGLFQLPKSLPPELLRAASSRLRAWWVNASPELEDLPWENIALGWSRPGRLSFARGRPPATVPPLSIEPDRPVTIALIDPGHRIPEPVERALHDLGPSLDVMSLDDGDPHEALARAARAGVEMVHIIADGSVPLGIEGLLDFPSGMTLMPAEVSHILRGSRVAILALSAPAEPQLGRDGLPTVFHGFARFGRAMGDGLTVVAPIGPVAADELPRFWRTFYTRFAETLDVEDALVEAVPSPLRTPIVLFLRHRYGRQFYRHADDFDNMSFGPGTETSTTPAQASADLAVSSNLLAAAVALQERFAARGLPFPSAELIEKERERQRALAAYIDASLSTGTKP
ncbi:Hypothetical protein A7982_05379 [Minicystis rosea]|nr:Hypothetical protein A7982_05379 [Minicystis rosea]